jgi:hypothetical protein
MGHGTNQNQTARGEGTMWFAETLESVIGFGVAILFFILG